MAERDPGRCLSSGIGPGEISHKELSGSAAGGSDAHCEAAARGKADGWCGTES